MKKLRIGVIGLGVMGGFHIKQYKNIPEIDLVGVSDADQSKKTEDITFFSDYRELLKIVDAVSIATPTFTHYEIANKALDEGVSVLIEKPIAMNAEEGQKLIKKAASRKLILTVGHIERFSPTYMKLEQEIGDKRAEIIDIKRFSPFPARIADVSCVMDIMIHDIDLALKLARSKVKQLCATGSKVRTERLDKAHAIIIFQNGTVANIETSRVHPEKIRQLNVAAGETVYSADLLNKKLCRQTKGRTEGLGVGEHDQLNYELRCFISAIINGRKPIVTGEDGLNALDVAEKVEKAALRSC